MYLTSVSLAFFAGGIFALLLRIELFARGKTIVDAETYNRFFTLHGSIMVFLFIIPSGVPAALGNFFLPIMIGAKELHGDRGNPLGQIRCAPSDAQLHQRGTLQPDGR